MQRETDLSKQCEERINHLIACPKCGTSFKELWLMKKAGGGGMIHPKKLKVFCPDCYFDLAGVEVPKPKLEKVN
jgi:protein-arginine kinase activator protein McsA